MRYRADDLTCRGCGELRTRPQFGTDHRYVRGFPSRCLACEAEKQRQSYASGRASHPKRTWAKSHRLEMQAYNERYYRQRTVPLTELDVIYREILRLTALAKETGRALTSVQEEQARLRDTALHLERQIDERYAAMRAIAERSCE